MTKSNEDDPGGELVARPDAEVVSVEPDHTDRPVDPPDRKKPIYATITERHSAERKPILPAWVRNKQQRVEVAAWALDFAWYAVRFEAARTPKYAGKVALWAPVGLFRGIAGVLRWAAATDGSWSLMQHAANSKDPEAWLKIDRQRERHTRWRWCVVAAGSVATTVGTLVMLATVPAWGLWTALAAGMVTLARIGRPADKPITDRVTTGNKFVKLTAEMVRTALCAIGAAKNPKDITFPVEIHRDGPGFLARINLPLGVEAVEVMEKRGKLSSALQLPVDQVWPTGGPDHAGQLDLWIGYRPASKMGQPKWSLSSSTARTSVFEPHEFGTDQRQRPVNTPLFARNFLVGGVPGSGKSYAARTLAMIAALDPTCELKIAEFKGTADFGDLAHLCSDYYCGVDDTALRGGAEILAWGLAEAERRGKRILKARERGEAPEGKVTPELAAKPGSGLHPVLILIDEAHELLCEKEVAAAAERLIKRGRALGLIVVLATQIPDKSSLPPNIVRCVTVRWCLAVNGQVENDMILGTGAYKRGLSAAVYRPGVDAGWGVVTGLAEDTSVRSHYPKPDQAAAIVARATALRGGSVVGSGDTTVTVRLDVLADVLRAFTTTDRTGLHWVNLAALLAEAAPETYAGITADALSAMVRAEGVASEQVKVDGTNLMGCRREAVLAAVERKQIER